MLIGISGKLGVGKSYYTRFITETLRAINEPVIELALADQIKINALVKNPSLSRDSMYVTKTNESRRLLQMEGTENGRNVMGSDIWLRYLEEWIYIHKSRGFKHFVVSDIRFEDEADYINLNKGILLRIESPRLNKYRLDVEYTVDVRKNIEEHTSETSLDGYSKFSHVLYNDLDKDQTLRNKSVILEILLLHLDRDMS